jgi:flagellar export protein FliJ
MPPKFSLQNVLDIRKSKVEGLEVELGKLIAAKQEMEELLTVLYENRTSLLERLFLEQQGEMDLFNLSMLRANIVATDERIQQVMKSLAEQEIKVNKKRQEIVIAKQEEEMLVILKNKQLDVFMKEQAEKEAKQQDDIYISQAFRQRQEESRYHG